MLVIHCETHATPISLDFIGTGIALLVNSAQPLADLDQARIIDLQTAFYCLTISMNILCTLFIAGRLWYQQRMMRQFSSSATWGYSSLIAVVIESAALYSTCGILYIPLIIRKLPLQYPITALIGSLTVRNMIALETEGSSLIWAPQSIAPNLIILRIALGTAVSSESKVKTSIVFKLSKLRGGSDPSTSALGATVESSITAASMSGNVPAASKVCLSESALDSSWGPGKVKQSIENDSAV